MVLYATNNLVQNCHYDTLASNVIDSFQGYQEGFLPQHIDNHANKDVLKGGIEPHNDHTDGYQQGLS
jgi:hypothetical protein